MTTLTQLLTITNHDYVDQHSWERNGCIADIVERYEDCWDALLDFNHSDWVNIAEPYTKDLLDRMKFNSKDVLEMFNSYCEAIGAFCAVHALEGECEYWEDGDDMNASIVNHAMTWAATELLRHLTHWADDHPDHEGPIWDKLRSLA